MENIIHTQNQVRRAVTNCAKQLDKRQSEALYGKNQRKSLHELINEWEDGLNTSIMEIVYKPSQRWRDMWKIVCDIGCGKNTDQNTVNTQHPTSTKDYMNNMVS